MLEVPGPVIPIFLTRFIKIPKAINTIKNHVRPLVLAFNYKI